MLKILRGHPWVTVKVILIVEMEMVILCKTAAQNWKNNCDKNEHLAIFWWNTPTFETLFPAVNVNSWTLRASLRLKICLLWPKKFDYFPTKNISWPSWLMLGNWLKSTYPWEFFSDFLSMGGRKVCTISSSHSRPSTVEKRFTSSFHSPYQSALNILVLKS